MNDLFLRAARGEATERRPVWMMRQAGRYLAEYRAIRSRVTFMELCRSPDLVAEVTLQPVHLVGVDAAIVFADILLPLDAMGAGLSFQKGDGPVFEHPVRSPADRKTLRRIDVGESLGYVFEALRTTRREIASLPEPVPLLGFGGTPWTLASYLVEGGISKSHPHLLAWSYDNPASLIDLLDELAEVSIDYLLGQIEAGAQAIQLFDTWGGLLSEERWRRIALPSTVKIFEALASAHPDVPRIFYAKGVGHLLTTLKDLPIHVLSVDWRQSLSEVRRIVGPDLVLQGNMDPMALLASPEEIARRTVEMLRDGLDAGGAGHIANLGHGIYKNTPPDHARAFVGTVKATALASLS